LADAQASREKISLYLSAISPLTGLTIVSYFCHIQSPKKRAMKNSNLFLSLIVGTVIWYLAALFIKFGGDRFFGEPGNVTIALYVLTPLTSLGLIIAARKFSGMNMSDIYDSFVILSVTGAVLDGVAIRYYANFIYALPPAILANAGAWLLWAVGVTVFIAYGFKAAGKPEPKVIL
jgi:hypothetical protein